MGLFLYANCVQAQDTTLVRSVAFADTAKISSVQHDLFLMQFDSQMQNRSLMKPLLLLPLDFSLQSYNSFRQSPSHRLPLNNYGSIENKIMAAERMGQSIQLNLNSQLQKNKADGIIGAMLYMAPIGIVGYQMLHPKPNPNLRPENRPPPQAPAQKGTPVIR